MGIASVKIIHQKCFQNRLSKNAVLLWILNLAHELVKCQTEVKITMHFLKSLFKNIFYGRDTTTLTPSKPKPGFLVCFWLTQIQLFF